MNSTIVPIEGDDLAVDDLSRNHWITDLRAPPKTGNALLKSTWMVLRPIALCPLGVGASIAAAFVLLRMQRGRW